MAYDPYRPQAVQTGSQAGNSMGAQVPVNQKVNTPATNSSINAPGNVYTGSRAAPRDIRTMTPPSSGSTTSSGTYGVFPWMSGYQGETYESNLAANKRGDYAKPGGGGGSVSSVGTPSSSSSSRPSSSSSSSSIPPSSSSSTPSTPSVGSTGVSSPGTSAAPPKTVNTSANVRQSTTASSGTSSTTSTGLLDFDKMFEYQKRINRELDMPTLRETNREGYQYRKLEGDDQMGRDTSARRDAAALAMQRDVLSSNLERGTMRQQQALQTRTKDQDLARAMSVLMKRKK